MDLQTAVLVLSLLLGGFLMCMLPLLFYFRNKKTVRDTQRIITDLELLRLFEKQPGGILSDVIVAEKTELTKAEASARLSALSTGGHQRGSEAGAL